MTVRSTQLRPSQQSRGAERAVSFAESASRRSTSLDAAIARSPVSPVASSMVIANPNRSTRRWGTVAVSPVEVSGESTRTATAMTRARSAHPTAPGRETGLGVKGDLGSNGRPQRSTPVRSNVVAMHPKSTEQPTGKRVAAAPPDPFHTQRPPDRTTASARTSNVGTRTLPQTASRETKSRETARRTRSGGPPSAAGARLLVVGPETIGATALAPQPEQQPYSRIRKPRQVEKGAETQPNLRVARPPRRVRRRLVSRPTTALFAIALVLAGAVSAIVLHADLAQNQLVLDKLRVEVGAEERTNQRLRVEVAELEAPARLISAATELGLVSAERVDYTPVDSTTNGR